jgi:energy-coupling factor transport system substrate-specific component
MRTSSVVPIGWRPVIALSAVVIVGAAGFLWPFVVAPAADGQVAHNGDAPWLLLIVMPLLVAVLVAELTSGRIDSKAIALLGVLTAAGAALRIPTGGIAGLELVFFLFLPAGRVFGRGFGFVLGAITIFASAFVTAGVGPWLPFQMVAAGAVGFGAGCLPSMRGKAEIWLLAAYGVVASYAFGLAMNLWFWPFVSTGTSVSFVAGDGVIDNLGRFWAFHLATSLGWDTGRAISVVVMMIVLGRPVLAALRRVAVTAAFEAPVEFEAPVGFVDVTDSVTARPELVPPAAPTRRS